MTDWGFWVSNLQEWLIMNGKDNKSHIQGKPSRSTIFPFAVWNVWKSRNMFVFNRKNQNPKLSLEIENQVMEFICYVASPRSLARKVVRGIRWEKPLAGWKKLNMVDHVWVERVRLDVEVL